MTCDSWDNWGHLGDRLGCLLHDDDGGGGLVEANERGDFGKVTLFNTRVCVKYHEERGKNRAVSHEN